MNGLEVDDLIFKAKNHWPGVDTEGWSSVLAPALFADARDALNARRSNMTPPDISELASLIPVRDTMLTPEEIADGLKALAGLREIHRQLREVKA